MCKMCASSDDSSTLRAPLPPEPTPRISKNLERLKSKHNIVTDPNNEEKQKEVAYQPDLLAVSTQYTKVAYDLFRAALDRIQDSHAYIVATKTSQPFHIGFGAIVLLVWLLKSGFCSLRGWKAMYVGSMATHFGAQVWMTLISGIVLYFNLPRHEFGRVQTVLFPVYYSFNAAMSVLALIAYFKIQCLTRFAHTSWVQFALLLAVASIEMYVRLRLVRPMLRAKHSKTQMEEVAGGGQEVGRLILGELAHCPRYLRVLRTFRMYHSSIAMGTMIGLGCSLYSMMILVDSMCH